MNGTLQERLKLQGFGGFSGRGDFFSKDGYAYQKERKKTLHTPASFSESLAGFAGLGIGNILF